MSGEDGNKKPFEIEGADSETIAIEPGEYYFNTKARCRRMAELAFL